MHLLSMTRANLSSESALFRFFRVLFKLNGVYFDSSGKPKCYLARTEQFLYFSPSPSWDLPCLKRIERRALRNQRLPVSGKSQKLFGP